MQKYEKIIKVLRREKSGIFVGKSFFNTEEGKKDAEEYYNRLKNSSEEGEEVFAKIDTHGWYYNLPFTPKAKDITF